MSTSNPTPSNYDELNFTSAIFRIADRRDPAGGDVSDEELANELKAAGVDVDAAWAKAQRLLKRAQGLVRLDRAHKARQVSDRVEPIPQATAENRESLIEQIRRLLSLSPASGVYAHRWESGSLEDLISMRDELVHAARREERRRNAC